MKLATFRIRNKETWGIIQGNTAYDVGQILRERFGNLKSLLAAEAYSEAQAATSAADQYAISDVEWRPVIPNPDKILCVGLSYEKHRKETGRTEVSHPTIFARYASSQTGHEQPIRRPRVSSQLDFEGELAVVVGRPGRYIPRDKAFEHIAGYACYNDGSIRDWQYHTHQFTPGKNFPETGSFGPWMMTPDELGALGGLRITTRLNGETVQHAVLGEMIFDIPTIVEYCSSFTRLETGDVIATGTPGGVGAKRTPPLWMKAGDTIEVEVERLGLLRNSIADEA